MSYNYSECILRLDTSRYDSKMANKKRSQKAIQERTDKKRKLQDAQLESGLFGADVSSIDVGEEMPARITSDKWEDNEQDYELKPRRMQDSEVEMVEGLPIKVNGKLERKMRVVQHAPKDNEVSEDDSASSDDEAKEEDAAEEEEEQPDTEERILEMKELIAELVEKIIEEPEENPSAMTRLRKMAESKNPNTSKFSMLALIPVWKSIIPGYRIRPLTEMEKKEKVSKDIARLRNFEEKLVHNYKLYIDHLASLARTANNESPLKVSLGNIAATAAVELAGSFSHFNFMSEVLTIVVRRVCKPNPSADPVFSKAIKALETLMNEDDEGRVSAEIVRLLSRTLKVRNYNVDESVLNTLLSVDVLHDYDPNTKTDEPSKVKMKKKDRVHLSKKQRKVRKEMKQIEEEMRRAEQAVSAEEREKNQAELLKLILALYLNVLKANQPKLIGSVLEGLAKFGHMANMELLGDFLTVMKELISDADLDALSSAEVRKVLLCIVTAFSLVSNHRNMKLSVDLSSFVDALYSVLPYLSLDADVEFSHKTLRLADPLNNELVKPSVNVSTKAELLLKALDHVFFRSKSGTQERAAAFTKRLYICMEHTPEKTTVALLKFLDKLMTKYPQIAGLYSTNDRIGNGTFYMEASTPARSNPDAATIWENALLTKHYCPLVVKGTKALFNRSKEST
ncbi:AaceriACR032Cp [[Ashbya] aceris (nom. inval.)]|nr:AaceriACR032Cp [[Ashbya] aceris (nom. inval.)]